jgi:DNA (cytosine-5)-methyltransferase 1
VHDAFAGRRQSPSEVEAARSLRPDREDPETQRSRATMWDVVRFAEYHEYRAIIVENVVEVVRDWVLFHVWWQAMENLGYTGQMVSLNSMFALFDGMTTPAAPQSRDRIYIVWTRDRRRKPDLRIEPTAPCGSAGRRGSADLADRSQRRQARRAESVLVHVPDLPRRRHAVLLLRAERDRLLDPGNAHRRS